MKVPSWVSKTIITTIITSAIAALLALSTHLWARSESHEVRLSVVEVREQHIDETLEEIKASQLRMEDKIDRITQRRN